MSTGQDRVNIYLKKFMSQQHMNDYFLNYLRQLTLDMMADMYPEEGFFYGGDMSADGSDKFLLSTAMLATDGLGHRLSLDPAYASIQFENALGIEYYVGLRYQDIPELTEVNVRSGEVEYSFFQEAIGELAEPDSVVDNGSTITFQVDSVTETSVSNAGRKVLVWLKQAIGQADAFFEGTVSYTGGQNKITTTHLLGQEVGSVSTDPSDYQVFLIGPTVKRNTDLDADPLYAFVGKVTGAGAGNPPASFDQTGRHLFYPAGSLSYLSDEVKSFLTGGGLITWNLSTETLTWADDLVIKIPGKPYDFTITAAAQTGFADGEGIYIELDDLGGVKAISKDVIEDISYLPEIYVIAIRIGQNIYVKGGLELKGAATDTSGRIHDITQDLLTYMGATDESDSDPSYPSAVAPTSPISDGDPLTTAINKMNVEVAAMIANVPKYEKYVVGAGGQSIFDLTLFTVSSDNTINDIEVYVDGRWQILDNTGGLGEGFRKNSTTQFETAETVPEGKTVIAWKQGTSYGGPAAPGGGSLWSDPMDASQIPNADIAHDIGSNIRRIREAYIQTIVTSIIGETTDLGIIKQIKTKVNGHTAGMLKGVPIAIHTDGKMYPAESDAVSGKKYSGVLLEDVALAGSAKVMLTGKNIPGVLTGAGFTSGDEIFIGETAGTYTNDPGSFGGVDDDIIRVGIADCSDGVASGTAVDLIMFNDVVARA